LHRCTVSAREIGRRRGKRKRKIGKEKKSGGSRGI
jgi:hypothetical protein